MERSLHMGIRGSRYSKTDLEDDAVLGFQVIRTDDYEFDGVASIVEVAPAYDHAEITGIAAATIGYDLLSVLAANR